MIFRRKAAFSAKASALMADDCLRSEATLARVPARRSLISLTCSSSASWAHGRTNFHTRHTPSTSKHKITSGNP